MGLDPFIVWREPRSIQLSWYTCAERVPLEIVGLYLRCRWRGVYMRENVAGALFARLVVWS